MWYILFWNINLWSAINSIVNVIWGWLYCPWFFFTEWFDLVYDLILFRSNTVGNSCVMLLFKKIFLKNVLGHCYKQSNYSDLFGLKLSLTKSREKKHIFILKKCNLKEDWFFLSLPYTIKEIMKTPRNWWEFKVHFFCLKCTNNVFRAVQYNHNHFKFSFF